MFMGLVLLFLIGFKMTAQDGVAQRSHGDMKLFTVAKAGKLLDSVLLRSR